MKSYPIMLILEGWQTVVVGSGEVALRKVRSLSDAGAEVTVVTEEAPDPSQFADARVIQAHYAPEFLVGAKLVFACTSDPVVNAQIAADARKIGALVNCVDQPEDCDFFVPAIARSGAVVVAVGTGGASPALAGQLKNRIAKALPERIGDFAAALLHMRDKVKATVSDITRRSEILKTLASESSYEAFLAGGDEALNSILKEFNCQQPREETET